jgi:hypothetical protein
VTSQESPRVHDNGVLLSVAQHFCDTATDEDVFRDLSGFPAVGANVTTVSDALNRGSVVGTIAISGIEQRMPKLRRARLRPAHDHLPDLRARARTALDGRQQRQQHQRQPLRDPLRRRFGNVPAPTGGDQRLRQRDDYRVDQSPALGLPGRLPTPWISFLAQSAQLQAQVLVPST